MDNNTPTRWSITNTTDLVAVVPYVLGFHPVDGDAVCIALCGVKVICTARTDLPAPGTDPDLIRAHLACIATVFSQAHATSIILIGYGNNAHVTPIMDAALDIAETFGLDIQNLVRVENGRYYSHYCDNPSCCPPEGQTLDLTGSIIAAQATFDGHAPLPNRQCYIDQVAPLTGSARASMAQATHRARLRLAQHLKATRTTPTTTVITELGTTALHTVLSDPQRWPLSDDEAAWMILLLNHNYLCDRAWLHTSTHPEHLALWMDLTRRAEPTLIGNVAGICALSAFSQGKSILGHAALDRVIHDDPTHPFAVAAIKSAKNIA